MTAKRKPTEKQVREWNRLTAKLRDEDAKRRKPDDLEALMVRWNIEIRVSFRRGWWTAISRFGDCVDGKTPLAAARKLARRLDNVK